MATAIRISGTGLTGTLRLTCARDDLAHVIEHAGTDEPSGTWIGSACPHYGLPIGSDVDLNVLRNMLPDGEIPDLIWEAPDDLIGEHNQAHQAAMQAYETSNAETAEHQWAKVQAAWSRAWAANCAAIEFMQGAGLTRLSPVKPQHWLVASFEHHCGPHGFPTSARPQHCHVGSASRGCPLIHDAQTICAESGVMSRPIVTAAPVRSKLAHAASLTRH
jgi:hypothetical protein